MNRKLVKLYRKQTILLFLTCLVASGELIEPARSYRSKKLSESGPAIANVPILDSGTTVVDEKKTQRVASSSQPSNEQERNKVVANSPPLASTTDGAEKYTPHILFIVMDDLGSGDLGIHGSGIQTPTSDRLAREGHVLNSFYTHPTCTTTRAALMTGRFPYRSGLYEVIRTKTTKGLPLNEETLPQMLQNGGYQTHAVGKWHLGHSKYEQLPTFRGFQSFYGFYCAGGQDHFTHVRQGGYDMRWDKQEFCGPGCSETPDVRGNYSSSLFKEKAKALVEQYDATKGPMFLYLAFAAVHYPYQVPERYKSLYSKKDWDETRKTYAGMLTAADEAMGEVVDAFKAQGLWNDTLVIFMTDNGGPLRGCLGALGTGRCGAVASNGPLTGGKKDVWEGGIAGDGFLSGPALSMLGIPSGTRSNILFHTVDWLPTLAAIAGVTPSNRELDGVNQLPALRDETPVRNEIFLGYSVKGEYSGRQGPKHTHTAFRQGNWKLVRFPDEKSYALYDLSVDRKEKNDLSRTRKKLVRRLKKQMKAYEKMFMKEPMKEDRSCPAFKFGLTKWSQEAWEPWCSI